MRKKHGDLMLVSITILVVSLLCTPFQALAEEKQRVLGALQITDNSLFDRNIDGMRKRLTELGWTKNGNYKLVRRIVLGPDKGLWNQLGLLGKLKTFAKEMVEDKVDAVYLMGSPVVRYAGPVFQEAGVPIVFGAVQNPRTVGCKSDTDCGPNITGVTMGISPKKLLTVVRACMPEAKTLGYISSTDEDSILFKEKLVEAGEKLGFTFIAEHIMSLTGEPFKQAAEEIAPKVDALVAPLDPIYAVDHWRPAIEVSSVFLKQKKPIISMIYYTCALGAVLSVGPNIDKMTLYETDILSQVLKGEKPGDIAIISNLPQEVCINPKTMNYLGLKMPVNKSPNLSDQMRASTQLTSPTGKPSRSGLMSSWIAMAGLMCWSTTPGFSATTNWLRSKTVNLSNKCQKPTLTWSLQSISKASLMAHRLSRRK